MTILTTHIQPVLDAKRIPAALVAAFLLQAAGVLCAVSPALGADTCQLKELASLPITETTDGLLAMPVTISGKQYQFALAIGADESSIKSSVADDLKLHVIMPTLTGEFDTFGNKYLKTSVPDVNFGLVHFDTVTMNSMKIMPTTDVSGQIGDNVFEGFDVEVNVAGGKVNLFSKDHCPGIYWADQAAVLPFRQGKFYFTADLDGKQIRADFFSGATEAIMGLTDAEYEFGLGPNSPGFEPVPNNPGYYRYTFKHLTMDGLTIDNLRVLFIPAGRKFYVPLTLSIEQMKSLRLFYAFSEKKLYITPASAGH